MFHCTGLILKRLEGYSHERIFNKGHSHEWIFNKGHSRERSFNQRHIIKPMEQPPC